MSSSGEKLVSMGVAAAGLMAFAYFRWQKTETLQVTTYNTLAPTYAGINGGAWYSHISPSIMSWENRQVELIKTIKDFGSDVICLQEVEPDFFLKIQGQLKGYQGVFLNSGGKPGEALFFRGNLKLIKSNPVIASDGRWAQLTRLQWGDQTIGIFNGHLAWDPEGVQALQEMKNYIAQMDLKGINHWVICGDFNVPRDSGAVKFLEGLQFERAYRGIEPAVTCSVPDAAHEVDFILTTPGLHREWVRPVESVSGPGMLPRIGEPSDHLSKTARFIRSR